MNKTVNPLLCKWSHSNTTSIKSRRNHSPSAAQMFGSARASPQRAGTSLIAEPLYCWSGGVEEAGLGLTPAFYSLCCSAAICPAGPCCQYSHN